MLGEELRRARTAAGMTQEEVAAKARISREYVSGIERGTYKPTFDVLLRIAQAMGTRAWRIVKRVEETKP